MHKFFYARLAASNLRKNAKVYVPYLLTCICTVAGFYIMYSLSRNTGAGNGALAFSLELGNYVIGIFAVIFLFYTNSFLIKRRKKEFGLYNVLGMEKKHLTRIIFYETLYTAVISLLLGLALGLLLSKLMILILMKMLNFDIRFGFEVCLPAIGACLVLFGVIHIINFLNSMRQVHFVKPIELLRGGNVGEREPRTKWLLALIGAVCLGFAYYIAITTKNPVEALVYFFGAVILVIIGTYCLFIAGSIVFLKLLRRNKNYYYKTSHFISISGMMYRMKQNAAGLASVCILATMVLVMVSSTVSLYAGMEDVMDTRYARELNLRLYDISDELPAKAREIAEESMTEQGYTVENWLEYRYLAFSALNEGDRFSLEYRTDYSYNDLYLLCVLPLADLNRMAGTDETLEPGEALVFSNRSSYDRDSIDISGVTYTVKQTDEKFVDFAKLNGYLNSNINDTFYIIVPGIDDISRLDALQKSIYGANGSDPYTFIGFDLPDGVRREARFQAYQTLAQDMLDLNADWMLESRAENEGGFYALYGGLFFLGLFLSVLFLMATALIIYYKQISEGYDDAERYAIMQKVGLSHREVKRSIRSQILTMFFLPLVTAGIHIAFAFPIITRLLAALSLTNIQLFGICTLCCFVVFAAFYALIYILTAKVYYRIVSAGPVR
jgi:putative ABC transport system permease protein